METVYNKHEEDKGDCGNMNVRGTRTYNQVHALKKQISCVVQPSSHTGENQQVTLYKSTKANAADKDISFHSVVTVPFSGIEQCGHFLYNLFSFWPRTEEEEEEEEEALVVEPCCIKKGAVTYRLPPTDVSESSLVHRQSVNVQSPEEQSDDYNSLLTELHYPRHGLIFRHQDQHSFYETFVAVSKEEIQIRGNLL
ncbi:hypothetical protein INR49_016590 [Caranx melampygus]|nr:hypothetical protein INR49_016590 [Caranx melampygus]